MTVMFITHYNKNYVEGNGWGPINLGNELPISRTVELSDCCKDGLIYDVYREKNGSINDVYSKDLTKFGQENVITGNKKFRELKNYNLEFSISGVLPKEVKDSIKHEDSFIFTGGKLDWCMLRTIYDSLNASDAKLKKVLLSGESVYNEFVPNSFHDDSDKSSKKRGNELLSILPTQNWTHKLMFIGKLFDEEMVLNMDNKNKYYVKTTDEKDYFDNVFKYKRFGRKDREINRRIFINTGTLEPSFEQKKLIDCNEELKKGIIIDYYRTNIEAINHWKQKE
ncbi:MAG: hypothetical protein WC393_01280 [Candidatus Nanoarchaeia archaeon]